MKRPILYLTENQFARFFGLIVDGRLGSYEVRVLTILKDREKKRRVT